MSTMRSQADARLGDRDGVAAETDDRDVLARRFWTGGVVMLGASLLFLLIDLLYVKEHLAALVSVKVIQCAILAVAVLAARRAKDLDALLRLGAYTVCGLSATTAALAVLRGEFVASSFIFIATAMATASFVPWGPWMQALTVVAASVAIFVARMLQPQPVDASMAYRALAVGFALFGSVWVAREHDVQRRKRRLAEAQVAEESRISAALARAGEEMIDRKSTRL